MTPEFESVADRARLTVVLVVEADPELMDMDAFSGLVESTKLIESLALDQTLPALSLYHT